MLLHMLNNHLSAFATRCIHAGQNPDPTTGAIMTPIYMSSTYVQDGPGEHKGYEYSRSHNPTRTALQENIASLEEGKHGFCFASGCAAISSLLMCLSHGDHVIAVDDLYGGTYRLFTKVFSRFGVTTTFTDLSHPNKLESLIQKNTKLIWIETPTNPMLKLVDIEAICHIAKKHSILVAIDNTFATPYLQKPLILGADFVVHSTTKYLGGHSDVIGGAIVTSNDAWAEQIAFISNAVGAVPSPMDAFLTMRGLKTLHVRMRQHVENAQVIAEFLGQHPQVEKVYYPGLNSHLDFELCRKQMKGPGGMISFVLKGNMENARQFLKSVQIFSCAESLGGVESLIGHPATMTHGSIPVEVRHKLGIVDGLIRLSVGIEDVQDLQNDLECAFSY